MLDPLCTYDAADVFINSVSKPFIKTYRISVKGPSSLLRCHFEGYAAWLNNYIRIIPI